MPPALQRRSLIGHSMGSLIALETAARHPDKVSALGLIGTAATMTVGPDLLEGRRSQRQVAIDMVSIWGLGFQAELGGSLAPGLWMHGGAQRVLEAVPARRAVQRSLRLQRLSGRARCGRAD